MKFFMNDLLSKYDFVPIWSHLLKKMLMKNFILCAVLVNIRSMHVGFSEFPKYIGSFSRFHQLLHWSYEVTKSHYMWRNNSLIYSPKLQNSFGNRFCKESRSMLSIISFLLFFIKHQFLFTLPRQVLSILLGAVKPSIVNEATGDESAVFLSEITKIPKLTFTLNLFENIKFVWNRACN